MQLPAGEASVTAQRPSAPVAAEPDQLTPQPLRETLTFPSATGPAGDVSVPDTVSGVPATAEAGPTR